MFGKIDKNQVAVKEMFGKQSEKVRMASKTAKTDEKMFGSSDTFSTKMQDLKINHAKRKNERKRRRQWKNDSKEGKQDEPGQGKQFLNRNNFDGKCTN